MNIFEDNLCTAVQMQVVIGPLAYVVFQAEQKDTAYCKFLRVFPPDLETKLIRKITEDCIMEVCAISFAIHYQLYMWDHYCSKMNQ